MTRVILESNEKAVQLYNTTLLTYKEIGSQVGLTRQRVHQILTRAHSAGTVFEGDERRLKLRIQERIAAQAVETKAEQQRMRPCTICLRPFRSAHGNKFCPDCRPYLTTWYRITSGERHEKHRLLVVKHHTSTRSSLPEPTRRSYQRLWEYYEEHGHLPPPNRNLYVYGIHGTYIREAVGSRRWNDIQRQLDEYYSDHTRKLG